MNALYFLGFVAVVVVGLIALDRWHKRRAWSEAERLARKYMDRKYGR